MISVTAWLPVKAAHPKPELSPAAREMLESHNALRSTLKLRPLEWSDKLSSIAGKWAETLLENGRFEHQRNLSYGENLFQISGQRAAPTEVVHDWATESLDYDYAGNHCHGVCGHYTQMVWRNTREVGCAEAHNPDREVWVCEYNPPGNYEGQRPY